MTVRLEGGFGAAQETLRGRAIEISTVRKKVIKLKRKRLRLMTILFPE
jgi:hypothetical protein